MWVVFPLPIGVKTQQVLGLDTSGCDVSGTTCTLMFCCPFGLVDAAVAGQQTTAALGLI